MGQALFARIATTEDVGGGLFATGSRAERWPFVGRESERTAVLAGAQGGGALVVGAVGVGKTRLVAESVSELDPERYAVTWVFGTSATSAISLGAFAAFGSAAMPGVDTVAALLASLLAEAGGRRLVLAVDDAHLLDRASIAVVEQLVLQHHASFVLTARVDGSLDLLARLSTVDGAVRLDLAELAEDDLGRLVERMLDGATSRSLRRRLWAATKGNPLLLRLLVQAARASSVIRRVADTWIWDGPLVVDQRLTEVVNAQLGVRSEDEHHLLELLAFGEPLPLNAIARLAGVDAVAALEALDLIRIDGSGADSPLWLSHPIYGEVLRAQCRSRQAARLRVELADGLGASGADSPHDRLRTAVWLLDADAAAPSEFWLDAARLAWARLDAGLAGRLARRAIGLGAEPAAVEALVRCLMHEGHGHEAETLLSAARARAAGPERPLLDLMSAYNLHFGLGESDRAAALLARPLACRDAPVRLRAELLDCYITSCRGRTADALAATDRLLREPVRQHGLADEVSLLRAQMLMLRGQWRDAAAITTALRDGAQPAAGTEQVPVRAVLGWVEADVAMSALQFEAAELAATRGLEAVQRWSYGVELFAALAAAAVRNRGRIRDALRWSQESAPFEQVPGRHSSATSMVLAERAHAYALLGQADRAAAELARAQTCARPSWQCPEFVVEIAQPWVIASAGDVAAAIEVALRLADKAGRLQAWHYEAIALHDATRLGGAARAVARLGELTTIVDGPAIHLYAAHAQALAASDPLGLEQVGRDFADVDMPLPAAEATARVADLHQRAGDGRLAEVMRGRARRYLASCQGARTPALAGLRMPELTARERQIADLAASGLTNPQIAEQLQLSRRTIENRLYVAYTKLGISGRGELRDRVVEME